MDEFDSSLRAAVKGVVVDAGHGGSDPGAVSGGLREKDFTLEAARYMYNRLKELGIPTVITRDTDRTLTRDERVSTMVDSFGNGADVLVLSNHINAGGGEGAEIYYPLRDNGVLAGMILDEIGKEGQIKRGTFQRRLPEDPSKDYYYIQRLTPNTTSLLLEYGYIDNPRDAAKLQANLLNYVEAVVRAVANYAGVAYTPPSNQQQGTYVVRSGDTLYKIANQFNTTVNALKSLNNLMTDVLQIGQVLQLPSSTSSPSPTSYIVKNGDSLWSIANRFGTTPAEIRTLNNLSSNIIYIGQELLIPGSTTGDTTDQPSGSNTYTVKLNDSLYKIASQYGISVQELMQANNLTSPLIQVGQVLVIPGVSEEKTYTVQRGDTIFMGNNE